MIVIALIGVSGTMVVLALVFNRPDKGVDDGT
jgi:hypothetical protein